ncbi:MAG TPA: hypothetical protein VKA58_13750 [Propionibacteriaceae bacterium]|jgi:hypothetical protein|nr:hypothetical protein [Propionibacteriaceae bacterium]
MARPLEPSADWRGPVALSTAGAVVVILLLSLTRGYNWIGLTVLVALLWAGFVVTVWVRARAFLMVEGPQLTVRRFRSLHTVDGSQVQRVTEYFTRRGPCHRLIVQSEEGTRRYTVPTALLRTGHSTLFGWLLRHAPQAELDKGSQKTLEQLRIRGLVE